MQLYPRESHVPVYPSLSLLKGESLRHCGCCLSALRTIAYAKSLQTASKIAEVAQMGSQNLLALTSRRAQISECLQMLEARPPVRGGAATQQLLRGLRNKLEWLDQRIGLELQESDPQEQPGETKLGQDSHAA